IEAMRLRHKKDMQLRQKKARLIRVAAYLAACMVALFIQSRLRKQRQHITYGPMEERDKTRIDYLNTRIYKDDTTCTKMIRLKRAPFFQLCQVLRQRSLLRDTIHVCIEEQVAMFLNTVGHNLRNKLVGTNFIRSGETVSRYFNLVLHAIGELSNELIRPPSLETTAKIAGNLRWDPYFKDCIGAIDGTHIRASVSKSMEAAFRGRKSFATQNVMAAVDFDLKFTYVLAGWEGTAHDAVVLADALELVNGLRVPEGKFYLVDAGYGAKPGFMPPFHGVRYHLNEWGSNPVQNEKELFNLRHSSLRVTVERAFRSLKRRFKILDDATPFFPFSTQVDIVIACCILHNWVLCHGADRFIVPENNWTPNPRRTAREQASDHRLMTMDLDQHAENMEANGGAGQTGFKQVHLNSCARALFENMGVQRTGTQVGNHLRKWKRIYAKVEKLKNLSGALWDEQNCMISFDPEHYNNNIKASSAYVIPNMIWDHREDANYLNTPIEHYHEMATIFGNSWLPSFGELSASINKLAEPELAVPKGLYEELKSIPGFDEAYLDHYYAYLCDNPPLARAFYALPSLSSKMIWMARYPMFVVCGVPHDSSLVMSIQSAVPPP
ncbi:hypothetical protein U9M48_035224, partial [Paspalum notatum var. saurae]